MAVKTEKVDEAKEIKIEKVEEAEETGCSVATTAGCEEESSLPVDHHDGLLSSKQRQQEQHHDEASNVGAVISHEEHSPTGEFEVNATSELRADGSDETGDAGRYAAEEAESASESRGIVKREEYFGTLPPHQKTEDDGSTGARAAAALPVDGSESLNFWQYTEEGEPMFPAMTVSQLQVVLQSPMIQQLLNQSFLSSEQSRSHGQQQFLDLPHTDPVAASAAGDAAEAHGAQYPLAIRSSSSQPAVCEEPTHDVDLAAGRDAVHAAQQPTQTVAAAAGAEVTEKTGTLFSSLVARTDVSLAAGIVENPYDVLQHLHIPTTLPVAAASSSSSSATVASAGLNMFDLVQLRFECHQFDSPIVRVLGTYAGMTLFNVHRALVYSMELDKVMLEGQPNQTDSFDLCVEALLSRERTFIVCFTRLRLQAACSSLLRETTGNCTHATSRSCQPTCKRACRLGPCRPIEGRWVAHTDRAYARWPPK
eukprot:GHVU01233025.1.p1 GENE.GHVU01233025.1~~GHVU01233025.1.p1  ORF type:complete len:480 (+),score=69.26 GHVU01233025.1:424-1863(+)